MGSRNRWDAFISFYGADRELARALRARLEAFGLTVFLDEEMEGGQFFRRDLEAAMAASLCTIFLCRDVERVRTWPEGELIYASQLKERGTLQLLPVCMAGFDPAKLPLNLKGLQAVRVDSRDADDVAEALRFLVPRRMEVKVRLGAPDSTSDVGVDLAAMVDTAEGRRSMQDLLAAYGALDEHGFGALGLMLGELLVLPSNRGILELECDSAATAELPWHLAVGSDGRLQGPDLMIRVRPKGARPAPVCSSASTVGVLAPQLLPAACKERLLEVGEELPLADLRNPGGGLFFDEEGLLVVPDAKRFDILVAPVAFDSDGVILGEDHRWSLDEFLRQVDKHCGCVCVLVAVGAPEQRAVQLAVRTSQNRTTSILLPRTSSLSPASVVDELRKQVPAEHVCWRYSYSDAGRRDHSASVPRVFGITEDRGGAV